MSNTYKSIGLSMGGILAGAVMVFSFQVNGQTINVSDDGIRPLDVQRVLVTEKIDKEIFEGTLSELIGSEIPKAIKARDEAVAVVVKLEALRDAIQDKLDTLPERSEIETP